jgi:uncharacterized membrane protein YbhN (UPF0104 family)
VRPAPPANVEERPALQITRRHLFVLGGFLFASLAALYVLLPQIAGLDDTWNRIRDGRPEWLAAALLFTLGMFGGYVAMFRGVFLRAGTRIGWAASYQITMAGLAASRLFAAGGAGGLVLTAWALRRAGMRKRTVADKTISFLVLTYLPYVLAVIVCGFGLHWGLFSGEDPFSITFVPAVVGVVLLAIALAVAFIPTDLERRLRPLAVLVQAFFIGMLGNLLPMPGGVGGVEGGMIGAFAAFDVNSGLAVVAVLVYRAFTFWLPLIPGVIAYFRLRRTVEEWRSEGAAPAAA